MGPLTRGLSPATGTQDPCTHTRGQSKKSLTLETSEMRLTMLIRQRAWPEERISQPAVQMQLCLSVHLALCFPKSHRIHHFFCLWNLWVLLSRKKSSTGSECSSRGSQKVSHIPRPGLVHWPASVRKVQRAAPTDSPEWVSHLAHGAVGLPGEPQEEPGQGAPSSELSVCVPACRGSPVLLWAC